MEAVEVGLGVAFDPRHLICKRAESSSDRSFAYPDRRVERAALGDDDHQLRRLPQVFGDVAQVLDRSVVEEVDCDSKQDEVGSAERFLGQAVVIRQACLHTRRINEVDESVPVEHLDLVGRDG